MSDLPPPPPAYGGVPATPAVIADYASWISRVGATLLDGIVGAAVMVPLIVPGMILLFTTMEPGTFDPNTGAYSGGAAPSVTAIVLLVLGYLGGIAFGIWNTIIRQGRTGQTLGKKWVGIKVVREATGAIPGVWLCLGRNILAGLLSAVTLYLNLLWPLWDAKRQTLHDKVVSTVVLRIS